MKIGVKALATLTVLVSGINAPAALADAISPQIKERGKVYSKEKPDTGYYGTGIGGRAMEASALRFEIERLLQDGDIAAAIPKAKKACMLDPTTPESHVLLARALTRHFYSKDGEIDEKLLNECLYEWKMIWFHSADQWEQREAKVEARKLMRIQKALAKRRQEELQARIAAKEELAKERAREAAQQKRNEIKANKNTEKPAIAAKPGEGATAAQAAPAAAKTQANPQAPAATTADSKVTTETAKTETANPVPVAASKKRLWPF